MTVPPFLRTPPRWVSLVVGIAGTALGLVLLTRPLTSLTTLTVLIGLAALVSGLTDAVGTARSSTPRTGLLLAAAWITLGILILGWPGRTIGLLAPVAAVALVGTGVVRLVRAVRGDADERAATVLFGLADIVFGVVAWRWPDVTLIVIALLFGLRCVLFGLTRLWAGVTGDRPPRRRLPRTAVAVLALVVALGAGLVSHQLRTGAPQVDAFYTAPADLPAEPGVLLRAEPFTRAVPDNATAWRILYTTTRDTGEPAVASGLVMVPKDAAAEPLPVIAWAHGTTGYAQHCAPSLLPRPLDSGGLPAQSEILDRGWAVVATDYTGLGTEGPQPYLIGQGEARSVLDAVRAAHHLDDVHLSDQTVVWGFSQGGHAALWTALLAPTYAPDVGVAAVAAMAPASDLPHLVAALPATTGGSVFTSYVLAGYGDAYPDVDAADYVNPAARTLMREMATRCLSEPGAFASMLGALSLSGDNWYLRHDPTTGTLGSRLAENTPTGTLTVPLLLAQGEADPLVNPQMQAGYVADRRADGWAVDYRTFPGIEHGGLVADGSPLIPQLLDWTDNVLHP